MAKPNVGDLIPIVTEEEFNAHKAEKATLTKLGHVKAETDAEGKLILDVPKSNYNATEPPTVNDDESKGYSKGSMWFSNESDNFTRAFVCLNARLGNAEWSQYTSSKGAVFPIYMQGIKGIPLEEHTTSVKADVSYRESHIDCSVILGTGSDEDGDVFAQVGSVDRVDFSNINTLFVDWEGTLGGSGTSECILVISSEKSLIRGGISQVVYTSSFTRREDVIQVGDLKGFYYVLFGARCRTRTWGQTASADLKIHKIWGA